MWRMKVRTIGRCLSEALQLVGFLLVVALSILTWHRARRYLFAWLMMWSTLATSIVG